jgi:TPR repeat protein
MATRLALSLTSAALRGDTRSQLELAKFYLNGECGLPKNLEIALHWLDRAKSSGSKEAAVQIGKSIPWARLQQYQHGKDCLRLAAESGDGRVQRTLAHLMLACEFPALVSDLSATQWLQRAVASGNSQAQVDLEFMARGEVALRGLSSDALDSFVDRGSTAAKLELVLRCIQNGDVKKAKQILEPLAGAGVREAADELARLQYDDGNLGEAAFWWQKLASKGDVGAMLKLARCHMESEGRCISGLGRSYKKAASWFLRALQAGSAEAAYQLYLLYRKPGFSMRNASESRRYLQLAAQKGHPQAQFSSALRLLKGVASRQARAEAAVLLKRAADQGHQLAGQKLLVIASRAPQDRSLDAVQREMLTLIAVKNVALATRLELGWILGLSLIEALWVDLSRADRDVLFECDLTQRGCRQWPRLILVESDAQREVISRAKRYRDLEIPAAKGIFAQRSAVEAAVARYIERCGANFRELFQVVQGADQDWKSVA